MSHVLLSYSSLTCVFAIVLIGMEMPQEIIAMIPERSAQVIAATAAKAKADAAKQAK
jgi:hypothetical protein